LIKGDFLVSRVSNIIKNTSRKKEDGSKYDKDLQKERDRLDKFLVREEVEKEKSEGQKTHERYRRKQKSVNGADLTGLIRPARPAAKRPGTFFYGTLKRLGEDFSHNIEVMEKHFTLGQSSKFRPCKETNKIYCMTTGVLLHDCETGESFE
tara:strand:+ start:164 stop:616 length:453 start_codon:yes stop_codon:yes gene_type:complete